MYHRLYLHLVWTTRIHPTVNVSRLVQRLKAVSATVANKEHPGDTDVPLYWSKGYAGKTVSPEGLEPVRAYLRGQSTHHPTEAILGCSGDIAVEYDASSPRLLIPKLPH